MILVSSPLLTISCALCVFGDLTENNIHWMKSHRSKLLSDDKKKKETVTTWSYVSTLGIDFLSLSPMDAIPAILKSFDHLLLLSITAPFALLVMKDRTILWLCLSTRMSPCFLSTRCFSPSIRTKWRGMSGTGSKKKDSYHSIRRIRIGNNARRNVWRRRRRWCWKSLLCIGERIEDDAIHCFWKLM